MTERRTPRKYRGEHRPTRTRIEPATKQADTRGYNAPSHMGGQFDDAGYRSGIGQFGFVHHATPPVEP